MSDIICGNMSCKYNDDNYKCKKKKIELTYCSINTLYQGKQDFLKCKSYKERNDEWYKNAKEWIKKVIENE